MTNYPHRCAQILVALDGEARSVIYVPKFREYGLPVNDGGPSFLGIEFCPFCGQQLPAGLRDEWFERLDALGLEPGDEEIPASMLTDEWWLEAE